MLNGDTQDAETVTPNLLPFSEHSHLHHQLRPHESLIGSLVLMPSAQHVMRLLETRLAAESQKTSVHKKDFPESMLKENSSQCGHEVILYIGTTGKHQDVGFMKGLESYEELPAKFFEDAAGFASRPMRSEALSMLRCFRG